KAAHEQAVSGVQAGDLERAKRGFLLAYIEAPRPILLYNLGVACRDLGQKQEARRYFRRYLSDPEVGSDEPTLATAAEELRKLDAVLPPDETVPAPVACAPVPEAVCPAPEPVIVPALNEPLPTVDVSAARWRGAALAAGAFGILSAGAGAAMFIYSRGENTREPGSFEDGTWLQRANDLETGGIVLMAVGGALTAAGVTTWLLIGDETRVNVGLGNVALATRF